MTREPIDIDLPLVVEVYQNEIKRLRTRVRELEAKLDPRKGATAEGPQPGLEFQENERRATQHFSSIFNKEG